MCVMPLKVSEQLIGINSLLSPKKQAPGNKLGSPDLAENAFTSLAISWMHDFLLKRSDAPKTQQQIPLPLHS